MANIEVKLLPNPDKIPKTVVKTAKLEDNTVIPAFQPPKPEDDEELTIEQDEKWAACGLDPLLLGC
jgi:hypothetical protein